MPVALPSSLVVEKCSNQVEQCLVLGTASARAKELSDLRERSPPAGAAVRLVLHHRHTLRIPDEPPDVAIAAFVENSRGHAVQQFWPGGVPTSRDTSVKGAGLVRGRPQAQRHPDASEGGGTSNCGRIAPSAP